MITTTQAVKRLYLQSDTAQLAASEGLLNVSAFARSIKNEAEKLAKKEIAVGTLTTTLYRVLENTKVNLRPKVTLTNLTINSSISSFTYSRTAENLTYLSDLIPTISKGKHFYTITQGTDEITIVVETQLVSLITDTFGKPLATYTQLTAVTVSFDQKYLTVPNMIYSLMASLAVKRINVLEIVSTLTSITFVVGEKEMEKTLSALKKHLR